MFKKRKIVCFIFARGGSKGIKNKNIKKLNGIPLISHAINLAKKSKLIDEIVISTDSKKIINVCNKQNVTIPFVRPKKYSSDKASEFNAWRHAVEWYIKNKGNFDIFISLPTTSPLRILSDINKCIIALIESDKADGVITVSKSKRNPFFNMVKLDNENYASLVNISNNIYFRRQDCPEVFDISTVCYVMRPNFIIESSKIFDGNIIAIEIPSLRAIDIDNIDDFNYAEYLLKKKL